MIHTKVTPSDELVNVSFYVPKSYIGKELEIIAFAKNEGIQKTETIPEWHKAIIDERLVKRDESKSIAWDELQNTLDREFL